MSVVHSAVVVYCHDHNVVVFDSCRVDLFRLGKLICSNSTLGLTALQVKLLAVGLKVQSADWLTTSLLLTVIVYWVVNL